MRHIKEIQQARRAGFSIYHEPAEGARYDPNQKCLMPLQVVVKHKGKFIACSAPKTVYNTVKSACKKVEDLYCYYSQRL